MTITFIWWLEIDNNWKGSMYRPTNRRRWRKGMDIWWLIIWIVGVVL